MKNALENLAEVRRSMPQTALVGCGSSFGAKRKRPALANWPDSRLITEIRGHPPNVGAVEELANRYWKQLFGRCRLLALDPKGAAELAHKTWDQVLRDRRYLEPEGDFFGSLISVAVSLWRTRESGTNRI